MGGDTNPIGERAAAEIVALRETWHTKNHPFYLGFHDGTVGLEAMAKLMAQHYQHVLRALPSFGLIYAKAPPDGRRFILENLAEEEGLVAGPGEDREPHDHTELIFRYCRYAGMADDEVRATEQLPAWRARSYFYLAVVRDEAFPVIVAMQSTQEGQQPAINGERTLPAFKKFHGLEMDDPAIEFFAEHYIADADHSSRQIQLVERLLRTEEMAARAVEIATVAVKTRWACMNEIYRIAVLGERDPLPEGIAA